MDVELSGPAIHLKGGMDYEAIVSQLQHLTKKVLCVEDGLYLRVFEECGPFPVGVEFQSKQKRWGMTEYFFRCDVNTSEERCLCVFGRDNAETFCPYYTDDKETSSEVSSENYDSEDEPYHSPIYSDMFTTSTSEEDFYDEPKQPPKEHNESHEEPILTPSVHIVNLPNSENKDNVKSTTYDL